MRRAFPACHCFEPARHTNFSATLLPAGIQKAFCHSCVSGPATLYLSDVKANLYSNIYGKDLNCFDRPQFLSCPRNFPFILCFFVVFSAVLAMALQVSECVLWFCESWDSWLSTLRDATRLPGNRLGTSYQACCLDSGACKWSCIPTIMVPFATTHHVRTPS